MSTSWVWFGGGALLLIVSLFTSSTSLFILGLVCCVVGFVVLKKKEHEGLVDPPGARTIFVETPLPPASSQSSFNTINSLSIIHSPDAGGTMTLPSRWDESAIMLRLDQLRIESPNAVTHYLSAVYERYILGQESKTAQKRTLFIQQQITQLKLAVEWQQTMNNFELLAREKLKRAKTLDKDVRDVELQQEEAERLHKLGVTRKELEHKVEIARLRKQLEELKDSPRQVSAEEQREQRRQKAQAEYERCMKSKQEWLSKLLDKRTFERLTDDEQSQYKSDENMWDLRIERARDELGKTL